jgi:allantoinase
VLHPFIVGQPYRLRALRRAMQHILRHRSEIWLTTPGAIASFCARLPAGTLPGSGR